jgi:hypothetical protein
LQSHELHALAQQYAVCPWTQPPVVAPFPRVAHPVEPELPPDPVVPKLAVPDELEAPNEPEAPNELEAPNEPEAARVDPPDDAKVLPFDPAVESPALDAPVLPEPVVPVVFAPADPVAVDPLAFAMPAVVPPGWQSHSGPSPRFRHSRTPVLPQMGQ